MCDSISRLYRSYCPLHGEERVIKIEYAVTLDCELKKVSFEKAFFCCEDGDDCPYPNGCPVYLTAPGDPF
jgi:hypothetical protein